MGRGRSTRHMGELRAGFGQPGEAEAKWQLTTVCHFEREFKEKTEPDSSQGCTASGQY